ncbi:DUF2914 domain-containing protein [Candidatus Nomurabacteria bacterium]|nr:DUF2914 domain-containing protein [Candidatus Nomurabacteria bacterium]
MLKHKVKRIKEKITQHERILLFLSLIFGFIVDSLTLNRADQVLDNIILISQLSLAGGTLLLTFLKKEKEIKSFIFLKIQPLLPYMMQYAFGGLFSGFLVLYIRSGALITSFPFLLTLLVLLISNEFIHEKYPFLTLQTTILFIAVLSYSNMITPVILNQTGTFIFILSTLIALLIISLFVLLLTKVLPKTFSRSKDLLKGSIIITFLVFHFLYFTNIIPPIPLSLKDGGIFHSLTKLPNGDFQVQGEKHEWYRPFKDYNNTFHWTSGETIYAFSAVFTPIEVREKIYHQWSYFDEKALRWIDSDRIPITIYSGRDSGFRGYSQKSAVFTGKWRVDIENEKGQVIGRLRFDIVKSSQKPSLVARVY